MEIKHAGIRGKESIHWYTSLSLSKNLSVRNVLIDTGASFSTKVYTSLDYVVDNIVGMDILRCYDIRMNMDDASAKLEHLDEYKPKTAGSAEIKVIQ